MGELIAGDLEGLVLPRDLPILQRHVDEALEAGTSLKPLYAALAAEHPLALGELAIGPRAGRGCAAVAPALEVIEVLEGQMPAKALFRRLLELCSGEGDEGLALAHDIVELAIERHGESDWPFRLSERFETNPGEGALRRAIEAGEDLEGECWRQAGLGHFGALLSIARAGHPQACAALLAAGEEERAIEAAAASLDTRWESPVLPWLASVAGADTDQLLLRLIPHLRSGQAARSIESQAIPFPRTRALLALVVKGLK